MSCVQILAGRFALLRIASKRSFKLPLSHDPTIVVKYCELLSSHDKDAFPGIGPWSRKKTAVGSLMRG